MEILFWILLVIILYTFAGYPVVLYVLQRVISKDKSQSELEEWPEITLFIAAYNEADEVDKKIQNTRNLDYPKDKLKQLWITDGSTDRTNELLAKYPEVKVLFTPERRGKTAAINRGMQEVTTPFVIFCDANTNLSFNTPKTIIQAFHNPRVGCVAGEKKIYQPEDGSAASTGEGAYWHYESTLKKWDAHINTAIGAAGELFAIRTPLFQPLPEDTLLDDFILSMRLVTKGYKIAYTPEAYAQEKASLNTREELKRKIRIAAGGFQSMSRLTTLLNPFRHGLTSWQYISHRVLRWAVTPFLLPVVWFINALLTLQFPHNNLYLTLLTLQTLFYILAAIGWKLEDNYQMPKLLFIPYYFCLMNYAAIAGWFRYINKEQSVNWERAKRA